MREILGIHRTPTGVLSVEHDTAWGVTLQPGTDPNGVEIPQAALDSIRLGPTFHRIPADLWGAFRDLCFHFLSWGRQGEADSAQEVAIILTRRGPDLAEWEGWVPTQEIGGAAVDSDLRVPLVNLLTGERFDSLSAVVASGRTHSGSAHSHNTMGAYFSSRDDSSELGIPGLHCVLGKCRQAHGGRRTPRTRIRYDVAPSIVLHRKRYKAIADDSGIRPMRASDLIDLDAQEGRLCGRSFHPDVLTVVSRAKPRPYVHQGTVLGPGQTYTRYSGAIRDVTPATTAEFCWVHRDGGPGYSLECVSDLPQAWQEKVAATRRASTKQTAAIAGASVKVGLLRNGYAMDNAQADALADMVARTLADDSPTPGQVWVRLLRRLSDDVGLRLSAAPRKAPAPEADTVPPSH